MKCLLLLWLLTASLAAQAQVAPSDKATARRRWLADSTRQARTRRITLRLDSTERAQARARGVVLPPAPALPPITSTPPQPARHLHRTVAGKAALTKPPRKSRKPKE